MVTVVEKKLGRTKIRKAAYQRSGRLLSKPIYYGNNNRAFIPEQWANEAVRLLWEDMVYAGVVNRDFSPTVAKFGEIVHTRKVGKFVAERKQNDLDTLNTQDAKATDIPVALNQRVYISFVIGDGERSKSFQDLIAQYLAPAVAGNAQLLDQVIGAQALQFLGNAAGGLGTLTDSNGQNLMLDTREVMNKNRVPNGGRFLGLSSPSETLLQKQLLYKQAYSIGDVGQALREAVLGRLNGFNTFLSLNTPSIRGASVTATTTTTSATAKGGTVVNVTAATNTPPGAYFTVVGDYSPLRVASLATLAITTSRPTIGAIANGAVVTPCALGAINQGSAIAAGDTTVAVSNGYPAGWLTKIVVDGAGVPHVGQLVAFRAAGSTVFAKEYCIIQVKDLGGGSYSILLDQPLADTLADNDIVCYGPSGDYNLAFQPDAIALVNRPLALPDTGTGARAGEATFNNMSLRVVMTYDGATEGTRVTVSGLFGVTTLDTDRGAVFLG